MISISEESNIAMKLVNGLKKAVKANKAFHARQVSALTERKLNTKGVILVDMKDKVYYVKGFDFYQALSDKVFSAPFDVALNDAIEKCAIN